jgi:hypothetical protein
MKDTLQFNLLSIVYYIFVGLLSLFVAENIADIEWNKFTLYDIIHEHTKPEPHPDIPTYIVYFFILYIVFRWMFIRPELVGLFFLLVAMLFTLRLFTFTSTLTPPTELKENVWRDKHCKRDLMGHLGFSFSKGNNNCIGNMFSGHASHTIMALMIILYFSKYMYEKVFLTLLALINLVLIITSRLHYTSDVIVGSSLASLLFVAYVSYNRDVWKK